LVGYIAFWSIFSLSSTCTGSHGAERLRELIVRQIGLFVFLDYKSFGNVYLYCVNIHASFI